MIKPRRIRWVGHVARMGAKKNGFKILVGNPEGKRSLGIPRCRWEDNVKMDLREIGWGGMDQNDLALNRDWWRVPVNTVMKFLVP
jgi:hypothetical protein